MKNILLVGFISLFMDVFTKMVYTSCWAVLGYVNTSYVPIGLSAVSRKGVLRGFIPPTTSAIPVSLVIEGENAIAV